MRENTALPEQSKISPDRMSGRIVSYRVIGFRGKVLIGKDMRTSCSLRAAVMER
jgi:hypothetical protein